MFKEYLEEKDLLWMLSPPVYRKILPKNAINVYFAVRDALDNKDKIYVHPDPDVDGFMSAKCWQYAFKRLNYDNYAIGKLKNRKHKVKWSSIEEQINNGVKLIIIVDSSSNDMDLINRICANDIKLVIIDHHNCDNDFSQYPENCILVNPKLENENLPMHCVSAGVLNALIADYVLYRYGIKDTEELEYYGYVTMYSDVCEPDNPYVASFMRRRFLDNKNVPDFLKFFWDDYSSMTRRFISFKVCPLINATIRMGDFGLIHRLFYEMEKMDVDERLSTMEAMINYKKKSELIANELMEVGKVLNSTELVTCILPPDLEDYKYNFLGYLASKYAKEYDKAAVCIYLDNDTDCYVGSARDSKNRDLLSEFSAFFEGSEGHDSAFGVVIDKRKLNQLPDIIMNANIETKEQEVVFDYLSLVSNKEVSNMALYNELANGGLPKAKIKIKLTSDFAISGSVKRMVAKTKSLSVVSFSTPLMSNSTVLCVPEFNGTNVECIVEKAIV